MTRYISTFILTLLSIGYVSSQDNYSHLWSQPYTNTGDTLDFSVRVSPANVFFDISSSYKVKDITDEGDTSRVLNWSKVLASTKEKNGAFGQFATELISTEIRFKDWKMNAGFGSRSEAYVDMDGPAVSLIIGGNTQFVDATTRIAPDINYHSWYQFNLGISKIFDRAEFGANFKLVDGVEHFYFHGGYDISTSDIFDELRVDRNVVLRSTSLFSYQSLDDLNFRTNLPFTDGIGFDNVGLLFDLYGSYRYKQHRFYLNIGDIGSIKWNQGSRSKEYKSEGQVTYEGIELADAFGNEFEFNLQDSLENALGLVETDIDSYSSQVLTKVQLRYQYDHSEDFSFGLLGFMAIDGEYSYYRMSLIANRRLARWLDASVMYSFDRYSAANVGLALNLELGRFQMGLGTQNILSLFDPYGYRLTNVHFSSSIKI